MNTANISPMSPATVHPDLHPDRLKTIVDLLVEARDGSVDDYRPKKGETAWSLGCRSLNRARGLRKLSQWT